MLKFTAFIFLCQLSLFAFGVQNVDDPADGASRSIPFKQVDNSGSSFFKLVFVFVAMTGLAYGAIKVMKLYQLGGLTKSQKEKNIKIIESKKLDSKASIHLLMIGDKKYLLAHNGSELRIEQLVETTTDREERLHDV